MFDARALPSRPRPRWLALAVLFALVASTAAACGTGEPDHVRIGLVAPLTGPRAYLGQEIVNGARFAIDDINRAGGLLGSDVELVVADDGSLVDLPAALADLAEVHRVSAVVGPEAPGVLLGPRSPLTRRGVPAFLPTAFAGDVAAASTTVVRTVPSAEAQAVSLGTWLVGERGITSIAVLVADPVEGAEATAALRRGFARAGVDVAALTEVDGDTTRFDPAVTRLRDDAGSARAVLLWGLPPTVARATLAVRAVGWDVQIAVPASAIVAEYRTLTRDASEGVVFAFPFRTEWFQPRMQSWLLRYQRDHGLGALPQLDTLVLDVPVLALAAYDAVQVIADAVRLADSREPREVAAAVADVATEGLLRTYADTGAEAWSADELHVARFHQLATVFDADPRRDAAEQRRFWQLQVSAEYLQELELEGPARAILEALLAGRAGDPPIYEPPAAGPAPVSRPGQR